jgi:hypothetical protein
MPLQAVMMGHSVCETAIILFCSFFALGFDHQTYAALMPVLLTWGFLGLCYVGIVGSGCCLCGCILYSWGLGCRGCLGSLGML